MVGAVPKPLPAQLSAEIFLTNIQHHRIFNPLRQDRNTVFNARINVGIVDMPGGEIIEPGCIFLYHFPDDGMSSQGCAFVFVEQIGEGQGGGGHGDDSQSG